MVRISEAAVQFNNKIVNVYKTNIYMIVVWQCGIYTKNKQKKRSLLMEEVFIGKT